MNLSQIIIKTKRQVFSETLGDNISQFKGEGYDFVELREYESGEDIKKIDWITSAKLQKPYVKVFYETKELNIIIASMLDGGVKFGTTNIKQNTIAQIVSILGFSAVKQNDPFSSFIFTNTKEYFTAPSKRINTVKTIVKDVLKFDSIGKSSNYKNMVTTMIKEIKKRSIIFIIGDFLNEIDLKLLSIKHEVIAIIVRDRFEENPESIGEINLVNPISNYSFNTNLNQSSIKKYKQKLYENDQKIFENLRQNNIKSCKVYTDEDPIMILRKLF